MNRKPHFLFKRSLQAVALGVGIGCMGLSMAVFAQSSSEDIITTFAGTGVDGVSNGPATSATFNAPGALAIDSSDNVYVAETYACIVRKIASDGTVTTIAGGNGCGAAAGDDGPATSATLSGIINSIAVDSTNKLLYISDYYNQRIRQVDLTTGIITTAAGPGGAVSWPRGLSVGPNGELYFGSDQWRSIQKLSAPGPNRTVSLYAGTGPCCSDPAPIDRLSARFGAVVGTHFNSNKSMIVEDNLANRVRRINYATGEVTTLAGQNCPAGYGGCGCDSDNDRDALTSKVNQPEAVAHDANGNIYIADSGNNRISKIMVDAAGNPGTTITTVVGGCTKPNGYSGDGGHPSQASVSGPSAIVFDSQGNLIFSDSYNHVLRIIKIAKPRPPMCKTPATYDLDTRILSVPKVDAVELDIFGGNPTGDVIVFSAKLYQFGGVHDFMINSVDFLNFASYNPNSTNAVYEYQQGLIFTGGKLTLCAAVPGRVIIGDKVVDTPPKYYLVTMQQLAIDPNVFHITSMVRQP